MYKLYNFVQRTVNSFCFVIFLLEMAVADDGFGVLAPNFSLLFSQLESTSYALVYFLGKCDHLYLCTLAHNTCLAFFYRDKKEFYYTGWAGLVMKCVGNDNFRWLPRA